MLRSCCSILLLFTITIQAQITGTVIDSATHEPIPYVNIWFEGEEIGATADENGRFELKDAIQSKSIVLSAVGYARRTIRIEDIHEEILLTPQAIVLDEVVIDKRKRTGRHKYVINSFKTIPQEQYTGLRDVGPFMLARLIPFKEEYKKSPYLSTVKFKVRKHRKELTFNLRLCHVNEDGSPGEPMHDKNIIVKQHLKKEYIIVDFSQLNITIPEDGFFVVAEFLIIQQNIVSSVYDNVSDKEGKTNPQSEWKFLYGLYGPEFVHEPSTSPDEGWLYKNGKWGKAEQKFKGKYGLLAAEVTLTD
jgi:hypothetical protein